jgi:hypothetical protein
MIIIIRRERDLRLTREYYESYDGMCVCVFIYMCMHACMYGCMYVRTFLFMCIYTYACIMYVRVYVYVFTYACICVYGCTFTGKSCLGGQV